MPTDLENLEFVVIPDGMPLSEALAESLGARRGASIYRKIANRVGGHPDDEELGHGSAGVAYQLGSDRVLKVTADLSEIRVMDRLIPVSRDNLVAVHDVFVVASGKKAVGVVVRDIVGEVFENVTSSDIQDEIHLALDSAEDHFRIVTDRGANEEEGTLSAMEWLRDILIMASRKYEGRSKALLSDVVQIVKELVSLEIYTIDIHPKNLGVNGMGTSEERVVLFDVGVAGSGAVDVPIIMNPGHVEIL